MNRSVELSKEVLGEATVEVVVAVEVIADLLLGGGVDLRGRIDDPEVGQDRSLWVGEFFLIILSVSSSILDRDVVLCSIEYNICIPQKNIYSWLEFCIN